MISSSYFFIPYVTFYSLLYSKGTGEARLSSEKKSGKEWGERVGTFLIFSVFKRTKETSTTPANP
jgi:hypothetical protein